MTPLEIAKIAANAARDKKASRIVVMDLRKMSDVCDFQLICSGENERQTRAIAEGIEERFKKEYGIKPIAVEGKQSGHWILLDFGSTLVHIFFDYIRDYYALEEIWPNAKFLDPNSP